MIIGRRGQLGETVIVRLQKGEPALEGIADICRRQGIRNGVILTGFGGLYESCWSGAVKPEHPPRESFRETSAEALEVLAISGIFADYQTHAHQVPPTASGPSGGTWSRLPRLQPGGAAIARLENLKLQRQLDAETKQKLLQVVDRYEGAAEGDAAYSLFQTPGHGDP